MGSTHMSTHEDEFWLFGYGSLIWKPPPHFDQRIPGWVSGYVRRFWQVRVFPPFLPPSEAQALNSVADILQASQDHRGTPDAPGRVVTLIDREYWARLDDHHGTAPDRVWGVAYRILPEKVAEVKDYLDIREINGYTIHYAPFHPAPAEADVDADGQAQPQASPIRTLVYIGTPDNDQFVGPQDPQALAAHIRHSVGPSGLNTEYLFNLHDALESLSPESGDDHIRDLTERVRAILAAEAAVERRPDPPPTTKTAPRPGHDHAAEELEETN